MAWWQQQQEEPAALDVQPRKRRRLRRLLALGLLMVAVWFGPQVAALTRLRERPLELLAQRLDGRIASGSATWNWLEPVEYRNIVVHDRDGVAVLAIERATLDASLLTLAREFGLASQPQLGRLRLSGVELVSTIEPGSSRVERLLAPWRAGPAGSVQPELVIEVVDAGATLLDTVHGDAWRVVDLVATGRLAAGSFENWTVAGRAVHIGREPVEADAVAVFQRLRSAAGNEVPASPVQVATAASAVMGREGGFSLSAPETAVQQEPQPLVLAAHRLPLGISELAAVRCGWPTVLDGQADMRLEISFPPQQGIGIRGRVTATDVHLLDASSLQEQFHIERMESPLDCLIVGDAILLRAFSAESPLFTVQASGRLPLSARTGWSWLEGLAEADFTLAGEIDLAAVARGRPGGVQLRPDVRVTDGSLKVAAASRAEDGRRVVEVRLSTDDLEAIQGSQKLRWDQPLTAWMRGSRDPTATDFCLEEARVISPAFEIASASQAGFTEVTWSADLERLVGELGQILDFEGTTLAGMARGNCRLGNPHPDGSAAATVSASIDGFVLELPGQDRWSDDQLHLEATGVGRAFSAELVIDQGHLHLEAGSDTMDLTVTSPMVWSWGGLVVAGMGQAAPPPAAELAIAGSLERWHSRLASLVPAISLGETTISGRCEFSGTVAGVVEGWQITRAGGEFTDVAVRLKDGQLFEEPRVVGSFAGTVFREGRGLEISSAEVLTATLSVRSGGFSLLKEAGLSIAGRRLPRLRGVGQWQADVGRIEKWLTNPLAAASWPASGRVWGAFEVTETPAGINVRLSATGNDLALASVPASSALGIGAVMPPSEVWREPRATLALEVTRPAGDPSADVTIDAVTLESSTASFTASGSLSDLEDRGFLELRGTASYDWDALSRLAMPWTGGRIRLAGSGGRPFAIRGPLGGFAEPVEEPPQLATVQPPTEALPESRPVAPLSQSNNWLAAARGLDESRLTPVGTPRQVSLASSTPPKVTADWLRSVSLETTLAWQAADLFGLPLQAGDMPVRLLDGQLAFGPFDVAASGGRLQAAPWLRILQGPVELVVPPGRIVERVDISQGVANRWMTWVAPLLGQATQIAGRISVETAGTRMQLADPFGGQAAGQVLFEGVEVTPGAPAQPLVTLIGRLQGLLDPRFGMGDKVVLMRVREQPVRVWLHNRRIWHEGLVMDMGQLTVRTSGSVAADGTLAMDVEMAFRGDIAGQTPIVATLLRTPLLIPLKGTIDRPQFDASAIDKIFARIAANTANAVIGDGISRGLEAIFGNPPPPAPPQ
jgi:hypothetical protein